MTHDHSTSDIDLVPESPEHKKDLHRAAWACSLGSALEYYDFALYTLAAALIFGPLFFPEQTRTMSLIASFGTYFLGFAIRPLGGVLFGMIGDRVGRKFVLTSTVLLMGISSTLIGALPTFNQVGIELGQDLLTLCTHLVELGALGVQAAFLGQQLRLLQVDIGFDIGQLAQGFVKPLELGQAGFAQVIVIGERSGELLGVLLVEQHLQVFLTPALIGGTGLNGDQALLFKFCAVEFFFLAI